MPKRKPRPTILADEHIDEAIFEIVEGLHWFKFIRASRDHRFRGLDEHEYIGRLRADNIIFLTQDGTFVRDMIASGARHAGIIWLPVQTSQEVLEVAMAVVSGMIRSALDQSALGMRDTVLRVEDTGVRSIVRGRRDYFVSVESIELDVDEQLTQNPGAYGNL